MRLVPLFPFVFASALVAQTVAPATGPVVALQPPPSQNCPVSVSARHAEDGGLVAVSPSQARHKQGYRLTLSPAADHTVRKVTITLHGLVGLQFQPADEGKGADVTETITLSPWLGQDHNFHSVVYTDKLTGVQWIELNEITYADGSQWHASAAATCRVAPNGFMLVASGK